jgi:hypothetical protein
MFEKVLFAIRGDQPSHDSAAAQPNRLMATGQIGRFVPETRNV